MAARVVRATSWTPLNAKWEIIKNSPSSLLSSIPGLLEAEIQHFRKLHPETLATDPHAPKRTTIPHPIQIAGDVTDISEANVIEMTGIVCRMNVMNRSVCVLCVLGGVASRLRCVLVHILYMRIDPCCSGVPLQEVGDISETSHQGAR